MDGEIDLETYTISIIRLNTALEKLNNSDNIDEIKTMFNESFNDLNKIYKDIVNDLNQNDVNLNEYFLFFQNGTEIFPKYIESLKSIESIELLDVVNSLINVFNNFNKISNAFKR